MLKDKNFTTFEEQIKILKGRKLTFINEEGAIDALRRYGYYNSFFFVYDGQIFKKCSYGCHA